MKAIFSHAYGYLHNFLPSSTYINISLNIIFTSAFLSACIYHSTHLSLLLYISISSHVFFKLCISHCISLFLLISIYSFEYLDISLYIFPSAYIPMSPLYKSQVLPPIIFFYMDLLSSV